MSVGWMIWLAAWAGEPTVEAWSVVELNGVPAGWSLYREEPLDGGDLSVVQELHIELMRGSDRVVMNLRSTGVESADGAPRTVELVKEMGGPVSTERWTFAGDGIAVEVDGIAADGRAPWRSGCLGPAAARRAIAAALATGAGAVDYCGVDPTVGPAAFDATYTFGAETTAPTTGGSVPGRVASWTLSITPGLVYETVVDSRGVPLLSRSEALGMEMVMRATDAGVVDRPLGDVEAMGSTLIRPSRRIARPREATSLVARLRLTEGDLPELPTTPSQRWSRKGETILLKTSVAPAAVRGEVGGALGRSSLIDPTDLALIELAASLAPATAPAKVAEQLRVGVFEHISNKGLGSGLVSASEAARSQSGDCTEHAVLLAALLRARGIPARVASGLVYVDDFIGQQGVFGYHMWTQALVDLGDGPVWLDVDAALDGERRFDATHLALAVSDLSDTTATADLWSLSVLPGRLAVDVLRVGYR